MSISSENRRAFHRIFFDANVAVIVDNKMHKTSLIDVSLNGALISQPEGYELTKGQNVRLEIDLGETHNLIAMDAEVTHLENEHVGLKMQQIDVDSISHLRRLVELNLGDSELLHRDLEHLAHPDK
ncbi:MAG: PilZ domain-containing protein [Gammaproteobacteria bacterium]|jgi:hypothetical protein